MESAWCRAVRVVSCRPRGVVPSAWCGQHLFTYHNNPTQHTSCLLTTRGFPTTTHHQELSADQLLFSSRTKKYIFIVTLNHKVVRVTKASQRIEFFQMRWSISSGGRRARTSAISASFPVPDSPSRPWTSRWLSSPAISSIIRSSYYDQVWDYVLF